MKKLITAGALVALFASPVFAQKNSDRMLGHTQGNHVAQADTDDGPRGEIVWGGKVRGQDPDPFIRESIVRGLGNYGGD